jgi:hypothetical protein
MKANEVLNILKCLNELIDLRDYKIITISTYNERNSGFCVKTCDKIIEITVVEEE